MSRYLFHDLVLDIGSNDGTWLACYQKHGLRILGVDGAKNLAAMANARGIETWARFFDADVAREILKEKGPAKLVTAAGVFFHLEELHSVTEGIAELIRDSGVFCVQAISLAEMLRYTQFDQVYHEHLTYWTLKSLDKLFDLHGLEVFSGNRIPIHGGSVELLVAKKGVRPIDPSVPQLRAEEAALGCDKVETYRRFADRVWEIKRELSRDVRVTLGGRPYSPRMITAFILRYLKICAERHLGEPVHDLTGQLLEQRRVDAGQQ